MELTEAELAGRLWRRPDTGGNGADGEGSDADGEGDGRADGDPPPG